MRYEDILKRLESLRNPKAIAGMARYGINPANAYGISVPVMRTIAREIGKDHALAQRLWSSGIHDARHIAAMIDEPDKVTGEQMERWAKDFNSWDIVDGTCNGLFRKTRYAHSKAVEWSSRGEEYVKRAGFVLMACLAVHDKEASDEEFEEYLSIIKRESTDGRNYVKKAANWALRQIGKRNIRLNGIAARVAEEIRTIDSKSARWIASDALRELNSPKVQARLKKKRPRTQSTQK